MLGMLAIATVGTANRPGGIGNAGIAAGGCMGPSGACHQSKLGKLRRRLHKGCHHQGHKPKCGASHCGGGPNAIGEVAKRLAEMTQGLLTGRCGCC
jgi:hypothetical protein